MDPTTRFDSRVGDYVRSRPGYPSEVLTWLAEEHGLSSGQSVADLGAGTGIWSRDLLRLGCRVYGVEPNAPMRQAAEADLAASPAFKSVASPAEATGLSAGSIDWVTAAQAFHWFDVLAVRKECQRILKPSGRVALLWNERETDSTAFLRAYEALLIQWGIDYTAVNHALLPVETFDAFFGSSEYQVFRVPNSQRFDLAGLKRRVQSSSYVPPETHPNFAPLMRELEQAFEAYGEAGEVEFRYQTVVYVGAVV